MTGLTWTILYNRSILEDLEKVLVYLKKEGGKANKGEFSGIIKKRGQREDILKLVVDIDFVKAESFRNTTRYKLNENGVRYLDIPSENREKYLHAAFYENILHYSYFYDALLEGEIYEFSKSEIIEKIVKKSANDFGVRIFDWKSAENVIKFMKKFNVITSKSKNKYYVNDEYRQIFNEEEFKALIVKKLKEESPQFTKNLCTYLLDNIERYSTKSKVPMRIIYKRMLNLNEKEKFLRFIPGLPRPPIPSKHTLVELVGVN
ncbi:MAG: hypothetical protein QXL73_04675 [Thermoplasmata archaeon]